MFRTSYVHLQEDYIVHADLYGMLSMRVCKQSTILKDVLEKKKKILLHVSALSIIPEVGCIILEIQKLDQTTIFTGAGIAQSV
jgi:hypothetical protein